MNDLRQLLVFHYSYMPLQEIEASLFCVIFRMVTEGNKVEVIDLFDTRACC